MTKIMLVEDDNNLREIYEARLLAEGYEIISAKDGEEALSLAMKEKPDLIISDVMMPKISGFDMLDLLRSTPETRDTKVIMMTALSQAEDKNRADKLGADRYLVKSQVTLEDVAKVAKEVLDGQPDQTATTAGTAVIDPAAAAPSTETQTAEPTTTTTPTEPASVATPEPAAAPAAEPATPSASDAPADAPIAVTQPEPTAATTAADSATPDTVAPTAETTSSTDAPADTPASDTTSPAAPTTDTPATPVANDPSTPASNDQPQPASPAATPQTAAADDQATQTLPTTDVDQNLAASADEENKEIESQIDQFVATVPSNEPPAPESPASPAPEAAPQPPAPSEAPATGLTTLEPTATIPVKEAPPVIDGHDDNSGGGSTHKKVIQPINDLTAPGTNLNELLEKEQQKEAASAAMAATPPVTSVVEPGGATVTPPASGQPADPTAPGATVAAPTTPTPAPSGDDPANVAL